MVSNEVSNERRSRIRRIAGLLIIAPAPVFALFATSSVLAGPGGFMIEHTASAPVSTSGCVTTFGTLGNGQVCAQTIKGVHVKVDASSVDLGGTNIQELPLTPECSTVNRRIAVSAQPGASLTVLVEYTQRDGTTIPVMNATYSAPSADPAAQTTGVCLSAS